MTHNIVHTASGGIFLMVSRLLSYFYSKILVTPICTYLQLSIMMTILQNTIISNDGKMWI